MAAELNLDFKIQEMALRIRNLREIEGLSIEQMAEQTGLSPEEYMECEAGKGEDEGKHGHAGEGRADSGGKALVILGADYLGYQDLCAASEADAYGGEQPDELGRYGYRGKAGGADELADDCHVDERVNRLQRV